MKNAIEAEKAKSAKIENDLKLELEAKKSIVANFALDLELHKSVIIRLKKAKYASEKAQKANLKAYLSKLEAEKITNAKLKWELEPLRSIVMDLKSDKAMYRKIKFSIENEKFDIENEKNAIITKLNTVIDLQLSINNLLFAGVDRKDAVIKYLKLKIDMISKECSVCMQNEISVYFDPCGHSYCSSCLKTSYNCAKCKSVMRVHI